MIRNLKSIIAFLLLVVATNSFAQHSLQLNQGVNISTIVGSAGGGIYTLPAVPGTLVTSGSLPGVAWVLGGNTSPSSNIFGTLSATDVLMQAGGTTQLTLRNTGGIELPNTTGAGVGVIYQGGNPFIHSLGGVFVGLLAGNLTNTGNSTVAIGNFSLLSLTSGIANTAVGNQALQANTTGGNNSAFGYQSLTSNIGGSSNSAYGVFSLLFNTSGSSNTAVGINALRSNTTASGNTAVGASAR